MLTIKENLLETIRGGNPDRFVNQYEYIELVMDPTVLEGLGFCPKGSTSVNGWGVTIEYPDNVPGPFPNTSEDLVVIKDITHWRDYVKAPKVEFPEEAWTPFIEAANKVDRTHKFVAPFGAPGIFEKVHYLMGYEAVTDAINEMSKKMF